MKQPASPEPNTSVDSNLDAQVNKLFIDAASEITAKDEYVDKDTDTIQFDDEAAVKLVLDDAAAADNYLNIEQWANGWTMADLLYQSPSTQSAFDGGNQGQASVPKYMVSNHISAIVPKIMGGIFYEDPCFLLRPRPGVQPEVTQAKTSIFSSQLDSMDFESEVERTMDQAALLGTGIMKWGYTEYTKKMKKYKRKGTKMVLPQPDGQDESFDSPDSDDYEIEFYDKKISHPWIKHTDIRTVLVNPGCRVPDIRKAGWVVYRDYVTFSDLNALRDVEGYEIPKEEVLKHIFANGVTSGPDNITMTIPEGMMGYLQHALPRAHKVSADPNTSPMELLERWDGERVIVVLVFNGHNILIRNEANPYGKIPFYSFNWRNIPDCFYGQGLGLLIGSEQIVEQGVTNLALDLLNYGLQPTAVRKKGLNALTQDVRWKQGGIIDVDEDVDKAFKFLQMPPVPGEAWQFISQAQASGAATSGANEQVVQGAGAAGVKTTGMRSGTGAAAVIQANASRLDGPTSRFVRQVFTPWLYQMDDLNNDLLPTSVMKDLLGDELGEDYVKIDHLKIRNARIEYEVLAGSKLGAKKEMAQALPIIIQLLNNPTFVQNCMDAGYIFDAPAIFKAFTDAAGWKFSQSFLRKMTPQEQQKHDANSPAALQAAQAKAAQAASVQKFQQEQQLEDQKQLGKAGNEAYRSALEHATQSELTQGEPGNVGFGSTTAL
jgi:hypothetical protein